MRQAATECPAGLGSHLTAAAWLRLRRGCTGMVTVGSVYDYLARRAAMLLLVCCSVPILFLPSDPFITVPLSETVPGVL